MLPVHRAANPTLPIKTTKKPRRSGALDLQGSVPAQREPGPVGESVDPLGELVLGLSVLPDGLEALGERMVPEVDVLPLPMPVVLPVDEPLMAAPPVDVPAPAPAAPPAWASANVLDKANADARTIVLIFMTGFLCEIMPNQRVNGAKCSRGQPGSGAEPSSPCSRFSVLGTRAIIGLVGDTILSWSWWKQVPSMEPWPTP